MIYNAEEGLAAIMFPVEEVDVFAETEPGRRDRIAGKKAIVNTDTRAVLSVVGHQYGLLENRRALELAKRCCTAAFPNTAPAGWYVDDIEAPASGGHCRIDLRYDGDVVAYDWSFSEAVQDHYHPFLRVTNSYNTSRVFSIHFGFTRIWCLNSVIAEESVRVSLAHTKDIEHRIEKEINEAKFQRAASRFERYVKSRLSLTPQSRGTGFGPSSSPCSRSTSPKACRMTVASRGEPSNESSTRPSTGTPDLARPRTDC